MGARCTILYTVAYFFPQSSKKRGGILSAGNGNAIKGSCERRQMILMNIISGRTFIFQVHRSH